MPGEGSPVTRLAAAARDTTQDLLLRTAAAGSSLVSWGQGLLGSAAKALDHHCRPPRGERTTTALVESIRSRGGGGHLTVEASCLAGVVVEHAN